MITRRYPRTRRGLLPVTGLTAALFGAALSMLSPRVAVTQAFPAKLRRHVSHHGVRHGRPEHVGPGKRRRVPQHRLESAQRQFQRPSRARGRRMAIRASRACYSISISAPAARRSNIGRNDITMHTVGSGCDNVAGTITLRFFEAGEDPLNPASDTGQPITETFTGRRVRVSP